RDRSRAPSRRDRSHRGARRSAPRDPRFRDARCDRSRRSCGGRRVRGDRPRGLPGAEPQPCAPSPRRRARRDARPPRRASATGGASAMIITIDGPAGAGKSTVARRIAKELSLPYLNSGALYRAITWRVLAEGGRFEDRELVRRIIDDLDIRFVENERGSRVILSGVDVTRELQEPRVASQVHRIASVPEYREMLIDVQRAFAREEGCVTDGRD